MYGVNANSIDGVVHIYTLDGGVTWFQETITDKCPDGPAADQTSSCFSATGSGKLADVTIWTHNNGNFKTF